jgi:competence protein ComEC
MLHEAKDQLPSTVLKVGHHGSYTSSSPEFLTVVQPAVAVYLVGAHNSYGHSHASTIRNLERIGARIYGTDNDGTVVVSTDGESYTVTTTRTAGTKPTPPIAATAVPLTNAPQATPTSIPQATPTSPASSSGALRGTNPCRQ